MDDVQAEFNEFFSFNDPAKIADGGEYEEQFELEVYKAFELYEKGVESGKVLLTGEQATSRAARFQQLYDIAQLTATQSRNSQEDNNTATVTTTP